MPVFLDMHALNNFTPEQLKAGLEKNADEFGVIVHQMLFNENEDILHCICEGPNIESIKKHHDKFNTTCDKIIEIDQIKTDKIIKEEKLKTIGEITSKISHDIRSPLSIIQTSMEMIKSTHPELYDVEKKRFERIFKAINQIEYQSRDVLSFLRERKFTYSDNNISDILNIAIDRIEIPMDVIIQKPKEDLEIICDFESLCTIFTNLIINAIQAMKNIGEITIKVNSDMDNTIILFENSGPPIPDNLFSIIFESLFTTKQKGTGLGLSSCKNIIEQHNGSISVKNNPTTFTIILPKIPNHLD